MDLVIWLLLGLVYLLLLVFVGFRTLNNGHTLLFIVGLFFPLIWFLGAFGGPTHGEAASRSRARLR